ncbi:hypothetical protein VTJ04DRAFT_5455 [Mycothermus thermophilus]|uniref:uncharacterized protein n=1 Tax=Humicola insolens TaxID=85995 RepID=UPI003742A741
MARFLAGGALTLLAARTAAAADHPKFEYINVVNVVELHIQPAVLNVLTTALSGPAAGALAQGGNAQDCLYVQSVLEDCLDAGHLDLTAALYDASQCMCCGGANSPMLTYYSDCASYVINSASGRDASTLYSYMTELYGACSLWGTCRTSTTSTQRTTQYTTRSAVPSVCTSFADIYNSCVFKLDPATADEYDYANCFCTDASGEENTAIQDYAKGCFSYARTSMETIDYSIISYLTDFCDIWAGYTKETEPLVLTTIGTRTGLELTAPTQTRTRTIAAAADESGDETIDGDVDGDVDGGDDDGGDGGARDPFRSGTSTATNLAGLAAPVPGVVAWLANLATMVLSFFILI